MRAPGQCAFELPFVRNLNIRVAVRSEKVIVDSHRSTDQSFFPVFGVGLGSSVKPDVGDSRLSALSIINNRRGSWKGSWRTQTHDTHCSQAEIFF